MSENTFECGMPFLNMTEAEIDGLIEGIVTTAGEKCISPIFKQAKVKCKFESDLHDLHCKGRRITSDGLIYFNKTLSLKSLDSKEEVNLRLRNMCWDMINEYDRNHTRADVVITPKEIYESLWKCRDFELEHLWQRSIFLSAFLILCFTGYGAVLLKIFKYATDAGKFRSIFPWLNGIELAIAFVGIIVSALWIMMGKGSKAWYEQYEKAISEIESNPKYSEMMVVWDMEADEVKHGHLPRPDEVDRCLLSTKAGPYSPSRINIAIGQLSMVIWVFVYLIHAIFLFKIAEFNPCGLILKFSKDVSGCQLLGVLGLVAFVVVIIEVWKNTGLKSSTIGSNKSKISWIIDKIEEEIRRIKNLKRKRRDLRYDKCELKYNRRQLRKKAKKAVRRSGGRE